MGLVTEVQTWLQGQGLVDVSTPDGIRWPSSRRVLHDGSSELVVITEDGGNQPEMKSPGGLVGVGSSAMKDLGFQVRVRATPWQGDEGSAKAVEVLNALHGQIDVVLGDTRYLRVTALTSEPVYIGVDSSGRPGFTISFRAMTLV